MIVFRTMFCTLRLKENKLLTHMNTANKNNLGSKEILYFEPT